MHIYIITIYCKLILSYSPVYIRTYVRMIEVVSLISNSVNIAYRSQDMGTYAQHKVIYK